MSTSIPYEQVGRTQQKHRTRNALIAAARELVASGSTPTVEAAAAAAGISRSTAFRYFPNQRSLLVAAHPEIKASSLLPPDVPDDPAARFQAVIEAFTQLVADTEPQQRTMLRMSLEPDAPEYDLPLRKGRAIGWIEEALHPLQGRLSAEELHRLVLAVRSATGIEARVWLIDIAGLAGEEATELIRWTAQAIYRSALEEAAARQRI
ncbi:MAG TPA: TetR family transcriptional regulator [Propionibacteriaceae bacterium]|nr:TetR family transcriptional regulator [Propionibacteriaceae bacterium]